MSEFVFVGALSLSSMTVCYCISWNQMPNDQTDKYNCKWTLETIPHTHLKSQC